MTPEQQFQQHFAERATRRVTRIVTKAFMFIIFGAIAIFICGVAVLFLWNWLMPALFHLPIIHFWQALGLLFLSWLLFGGHRGFVGRRRHGRGAWRQRMWERWENMTPEEREKFREGMRDCWGRVAPPASKPGA